MKTALSIAGSDSSGGAGIQADIKTMSAHGVYAMTAVTALTAQNTTGVTGILESPADFLAAQLDAVFTDIFPDAVKIGMIPSAELICTAAEKLQQYGARNIVVDPVMVATSGSRLMQAEALDALKTKLLPLAALVTPNIPEAQVISGMEIKSVQDMEEAAQRIHRECGCPVLLKGGHALNDANDLLWTKDGARWFHGRRIDNPNTHGTGCTLSSAIASNLAKGMALADAVGRAKEYISGALAAMLDLGSGSGPMNHLFDLRSGFIGGGEDLCTRLRRAAAQVWDACLNHPFVQGVGDGSLPVEKFQYYMLQDYLYLFEYARVFAAGVMKAGEEEVMQRFARSVEAILNGEMNIHRAYMQRLGITAQQVQAVRPALDNLSYTAYMQGVAHRGSALEIVAAVLACSWSYGEIGRELAGRPGAAEHPFYGEWIQGYASEDYDATNRTLMELANRLGEGASEDELARAEEIFINCSRHELRFWDMAWELRT
ncbi:MAG: bifunctional hydroxymethylpyrimidine kinase/phosphomethylpyrimidine kinase [Clostridia bacterium]|nr:bifunctional hydroxymethylpyrimidine kinase/phosphomethylpyrimidine kinase [Clostridia bacterium]